jgi:tetratricopeptide (TPR) repeat protein
MGLKLNGIKMKRIFLSILLVTSIFALSFSQQNADELLKKNHPFVVKFTAGTNGIIYREGFGYYAKDLGYVLTPYNSVVGFDLIKFVDNNGDTLEAKGVVGLDQIADLILLKVAEPQKDKALLDFSGKLKSNEKIFVIGVDTRKTDTLYSGIVTDAYTTNDGVTLYNSSIKMVPGQEGGLVFNEQMKLVGLTKGIFRNNFFSTYVLPLKYAKNMLEISKRKILPLTDSLVFSIFNVSYWRGIYAVEKGVGEYDEALYHFKIALTQKPKDLNTLFQLGLAFGLKNQFDSSIYYYGEALKIDPKFTFGYINLAVANIMKQNYAPAVKALKEAVKLNSQYPETYYFLAFALLKNDQPDEAIKMFKKALEFQPNNAEVLEQLSEAYYAGKKYRDAIKTANKALKLDPKAANALYVLGLTNIELGNKEEAEKIYKTLDNIDKTRSGVLRGKLDGK